VALVSTQLKANSSPPGGPSSPDGPFPKGRQFQLASNGQHRTWIPFQARQNCPFDARSNVVYATPGALRGRERALASFRWTSRAPELQARASSRQGGALPPPHTAVAARTPLWCIAPPAPPTTRNSPVDELKRDRPRGTGGCAGQSPFPDGNWVVFDSNDPRPIMWTPDLDCGTAASRFTRGRGETMPVWSRDYPSSHVRRQARMPPST
jgi:hypothetical protein